MSCRSGIIDARRAASTLMMSIPKRSVLRRVSVGKRFGLLGQASLPARLWHSALAGEVPNWGAILVSGKTADYIRQLNRLNQQEELS